MGFHPCPIEPDDWSNGPNDPIGRECMTCEGTGMINDENGEEKTCPSCHGDGEVPYDPDDDEWNGHDGR